ncbi:MAG: RNA 2',3'-cyclic phosphodiesterase [Candidatus Dormibacter sp.]
MSSKVAPDRAKPRWRLFLAASLSEAVRGALTPPLDALASLRPKVDPSRLDAIHLTLHFLGNVELARVDDLSCGLPEAVGRFERFEVIVSGVGAFPSMVTPRIIWAGITGPDRSSLLALQAATAAPLAGAGIALDDRPYAPHLTLARVRPEAGPRERRELASWAERWADGRFGVLRIDAIQLMRSDLAARPPRYTALESFPLQ